MTNRAILVWKGPVDPTFWQVGYLNNRLSQAALDIDHVPSSGVVVLKQSVEQVQHSPLDHTGWALYTEQVDDTDIPG